MKAVVLTLAVLFLTGSQAQHFLQQNDLKSQWDRVKNLAAVYREYINEGGKNYVAHIKSLIQTEKLNSSLDLLKKWNTTSTWVTNLHNGLSLLTQELWENLKYETVELTKDLTKDLEGVKEKVQPYLDEFQLQWQDEAEVYLQKVVLLGQNIRDCQQDLHKHLSSLQWQDEAEVYLQKAVLLGQNIRDCQQDLHKHLSSLGGKLRDDVRRSVGSVRSRLGPPEEVPTLLNEYLNNFFNYVSKNLAH